MSKTTGCKAIFPCMNITRKRDFTLLPLDLVQQRFCTKRKAQWFKNNLERASQCSRDRKLIYISPLLVESLLLKMQLRYCFNFRGFSGDKINQFCAYGFLTWTESLEKIKHFERIYEMLPELGGFTHKLLILHKSWHTPEVYRWRDYCAKEKFQI